MLSPTRDSTGDLAPAPTGSGPVWTQAATARQSMLQAPDARADRWAMLRRRGLSADTSTPAAPVGPDGAAPSPQSSSRATAVPATSEPVVPPPASAPLADGERGVAGASARAERVRRSAKREADVRARHPKLGGFILAVGDDPRSTKVWDQGAVGEERVGATLEAARPSGIEVLHDRRIPRSRANIDHLVIAPNGVWVVDAKRYLNGKLTCRDVGGWLRADRRLYVGSRDRTALVDGVLKQVDVVAAALAAAGLGDVPVHGALCFVEVQLGWFAKPFTLRGVSVTWREHLVAPMLAPQALAEATRVNATVELSRRFQPA
ncbi:MAG: hypothetical protein JWN46_3267 [Acidimicrobiales bacterium]|nr:hypothetical protein [Acidimicrobiales bacterium]